MAINKEKTMIDKTDFIIKEVNDKRRKNGKAKHKLYRVICDICGEPTRYGSGYSKAKDKKNRCKRCQYEKLSKEY